MTREQFIRELRGSARSRGLELTVNMARGKGGHCVVRCGARFAVVKSGEITPLMAKIIRKQLEL